MDRPVTSKARGICKYYTEPRGCYAGDNCKFLHGRPEDTKLSPHDQSKKCRFYAKGYCKKGKHCWFRHVDPPHDQAKDEDEETCCICFEKPFTFGLLSGCSHVFCLECIRQWRDPSGKQADVVISGNTKKCPMCRASTKFITPSSRFYTVNDPRRDRTIIAYKESMARVPCKYYQDSVSSPSGNPFCPFGKDCFYQHRNQDGTTYVFKDGVDKYMPIHQARQNDYTFTFNLASLLEFTSNGAEQLSEPNSNLLGTHAGQSQDDVGDMENVTQRDTGGERHDRSTVLQAVEAIRAGLERIAGQRLVAEVVSQVEDRPPGFGWLGPIPDPGRVIDRLEVLTREVRHTLRHRNGSPPPLEPEVLFNINSPAINDGDDETESMPGLESVSNSSDEEYEDADVDDLDGSSSSERDELHPWQLAPDYNILGDIADWENLNGTESEHNLNAPVRPPEEPQFVTDGRGRVVGSAAASPMTGARDKGIDGHEGQDGNSDL